MSESKRYVTFAGSVQQFPGKEAVEKRPASNQEVHTVTIRTANQSLLGLTIWPELGHVAEKIKGGYFLAGDGSYSETQGKNGQTYQNVSVTNLVVIPNNEKVERDVMNAVETPAAVSPFSSTSF